jgi:hypothetical protein
MNPFITQIGPMFWAASLRGEGYICTANGRSDFNAAENLEGKLVARLNELDAEADWIRKALSKKFPINTLT